MSVLTKIKSLETSFTANEKRIGDFISKSPSKLKELSSQQFASELGVSQSSIVKFTQKLGFKGYPALKLALVEAGSDLISGDELLSDISASDDIQQLSRKLLASKLNVLKQTLQQNDADTIEHAVEYIIRAKRVLIIGTGPSAMVAKDLCDKLRKVGVAAVAESSGYSQIAYAATFTHDDLLIAINESGQSKEVLQVVATAQQTGAKLVAITGQRASKLRGLSDVCLSAVTETSDARLFTILAQTSQQLIIDTLFLALTQKSAEYRQQLEKSNLAVLDPASH